MSSMLALNVSPRQAIVPPAPVTPGHAGEGLGDARRRRSGAYGVVDLPRRPDERRAARGAEWTRNHGSTEMQ